MESRPAHRETDLAAIDAAWDDLRTGRPGVVVIEGARGIGKSSLLAAAVARLPAPAVVLRARCTAAEQGYQFGVVEQLFDRTVAVGPSGPGGSGGGADASPGVLHGYLQVARSMSATTPVVVAIDDLHLADEQSLQWLSYLTRRLDEQQLAVVVTVEAGSSAAADLERIVDDVGSHGFAAVLRPEPLCETCVEDAAAALLDGPLDTELAIVCHELSRGNPLILREYVNRLRVAGVAPGSPDPGAMLTIGAATLADTALTWLDERAPAAAELLVSMAVLGPSTGHGHQSDAAIAAMLVGQSELEAAESLRVLRRAGLVVPGEPARVAGSLVGSAALSRVSAPRRIELHLAAAQLLTRLGSTARRAADHLLLVGADGRDWAVGILRAAAREAADQASVDAAVRYLRRAAAECDPASAELRLEIARLELHHDLPSAVRCIESVQPDLTTLLERADGLTSVASPMLLAEGTAVIAPFVDVAHELVTTPGALRRDHLPLGALSVLVGQPASLPVWLRALSASTRSASGVTAGPVPASDVPERALLSSLAAMSAATGRHRGRTMRLARRAADGAMDLGADAFGATVAAFWSDEFVDAERWATWMVDTARARDHRGGLVLGLVVRAAMCARLRSPQSAVEDSGEAVVLAESLRAAGLRSLAAAAGAGALLSQGHVEPAGDLLAGAPVPLGAHPLVQAAVLRVRGMVLGRAGDHAAALRLFQECGYTLAARGLVNPNCVLWRRELVECHLALGDRAAARAVAEDDLALAIRWGTAGAIGRALLARSRTETGPAAIATAEDAAGRLLGAGIRLEYARACAHLATLYRDAGDDDAAEHALRLGATESAAAGEPAPRVLVASVPGESGHGADRPPRLTFSEGRVTDLVLQGMTNQEVADALCISRRTVDTHLNRIYRKFAINSRGELAELLRGGA